ncbi:hypothetical protein Scep_019566 [Stephania cephalantha]|uniref:Uncharacterized protein n=1 Tax=Stephania cephalantha TaxID=152367 RepID=A0AAP0IB97_9MAGN
MRATYEAFKKKSEQMSTNRKSEVGGSGTGISLHSAGSISARQHGDTLEKKLQRRPTRKEMFRHLHTHGHDGQSFVDQRSAKIDVNWRRFPPDPDTSVDEDAVYLEVVPEVKGRVYGLAQGYHCRYLYGKQAHLEDQRTDLMSLKSSNAGPPKVARNIVLKERMERQEQMRERQDGTPRKKLKICRA